MNWKTALWSGGKGIANFLRSVRWKDPLVQVRLMAGGLILAGIGVHYVRGAGAGEQKNSGDAFTLLPVGVPVDSWKPSATLGQAYPELTVSGQGLEPDLRAVAEASAAQPGWKALSGDLRRAISALHGVERITVKWSGTRGGDAEALDLYHSDVKGKSQGLDCDFLIGNGLRGVDGLIEETRRWQACDPAARREITVCLVGSGDLATAAQLQALGELITAIEAGSGRITLAMHQAERPGLLADTD